MLLALALVQLGSVQDLVGGLRAGESAIVLDATLAFAGETITHSRVLHAQTGEPLADVMVEAWTENGEQPVGIAERVDRAFTHQDGSVDLETLRKSRRAAKVRLSKAGFASTEVPISDLFGEEIRLSPAWPFEGRVLDVNGKPVAGAILRTRESCAHAVKASQTRTDAFGRFRMVDFPTNDNGPEIEILGENIAPIGHLEGLDMRRLAAFYGALDIYVAKRAPIDMRLIDASGAPLSHRRVITREAPMYESWSDEDGLCRMFPPENSRAETFWICDMGSELTISETFPVTSTIDVLPWPFEHGRELDARLVVSLEGLDATRAVPEIRFHADFGRSFAVENETSELPTGRGRLLLGGRFDAYAPVDIPLELVAGENRVTVRLVPNPLVRLKLLEGSYDREYVQAGDDSTVISNPTENPDDFGCFVPAGVPITILRDAVDGEIRRVQLPAITADTAVDLTRPEAIVRAGLSDAAQLTGTLHFKVVDRAGLAIEGAQGRVWAQGASIDYAPSATGTFTWTLPACASYRAAFTAPGCTDLYFQGSVPTRGDAPEVRVAMQRRAKVTIVGAVKSLVVPGPAPDEIEGGFAFDAASGPLMIRVLRTDGEMLALELTLNEGESRRLEVR